MRVCTIAVNAELEAGSGAGSFSVLGQTVVLACHWRTHTAYGESRCGRACRAEVSSERSRDAARGAEARPEAELEERGKVTHLSNTHVSVRTV